jgi:hypothetical protein
MPFIKSVRTQKEKIINGERYILKHGYQKKGYTRKAYTRKTTA